MEINGRVLTPANKSCPNFALNSLSSPIIKPRKREKRILNSGVDLISAKEKKFIYLI